MPPQRASGAVRGAAGLDRDADRFEEELVFEGEAVFEGGGAGVAVVADTDEGNLGRVVGCGAFARPHPIHIPPSQKIVVVHRVKPVIPITAVMRLRMEFIFANRRNEGCDTAHRCAGAATEEGERRVQE